MYGKRSISEKIPKRLVLSLEQTSEEVMDGESGEEQDGLG